MAQGWDYRIEEIRLSDKWSTKAQQEELTRFRSQFNDLGTRGWELVSYQAVPMTGSINVTSVNGYAYLAIFKRPSMPPPEDRSPDWKHDPASRGVGRYWDGNRWTATISHPDGTTSEDW
jgi:hypothetical protein